MPPYLESSDVRSPSAPRSVRRARPWVLVYEPEACLLRRIVALLESLGFVACGCADAGDAATRAQTVPYLAGLIVDLEDLTAGGAVAEAVRKRQPDVRVLCLSSARARAHGDPVDLEIVGRLLAHAPAASAAPRAR